jgi:lysozyme
MRIVVVAVMALVLAACGGKRAEVASSRAEVVSTRAVTVAPRFGDTDPHDWERLAPWHYPVHGIDVSKWQGDIDWGSVRGSGVAFAFIKATEGGDVADDRFLANWDGARRAGVTRGAYHFFYFCRSAAEQADWFVRHVPRDASSLPPVLDVEWNHRSRTCPIRPAPAEVRAEMATFLGLVGRHYGRRPIIYTTVDFWRDNELWRVGGHEFWLRSVAGHPGEVYPAQPWSFWQYTGTGEVPGIAGHTDINVFAGSFPQWHHWLSTRTR